MSDNPQRAQTERAREQAYTEREDDGRDYSEEQYNASGAADETPAEVVREVYTGEEVCAMLSPGDVPHLWAHFGDQWSYVRVSLTEARRLLRKGGDDTYSVDRYCRLVWVLPTC